MTRCSASCIGAIGADKFERDVRLIFSNCAWFNEPWSEAAQDGKRTLAPRTSPVSNALPALTPLP